MGYAEIADRVLGMLQRADGNDPSRGHLTMNNWEWPTGVALYGIYKTYQQSGDRKILDYLTGWYDDMLSREQKPHRNVNTVAPVLTLTCLYAETKNPAYLPVIESWIDWVMKEMPRTEYEGLQHCTVWNKHYQQLWCDTLFMVGLFLAKAGVVLERPELIEEAEYQFLIHIRYLQNKVNGLFYHGWTFDRPHPVSAEQGERPVLSRMDLRPAAQLRGGLLGPGQRLVHGLGYRAVRHHEAGERRHADDPLRLEGSGAVPVEIPAGQRPVQHADRRTGC